MSLQSSKFSLNLSGGETKTVGLQTIPADLAHAFAATLTDGTGVGKAQKVVTIQAALTAIADATTAPTLVGAGTGGSVAAGTYTLGYTWYNAAGETLPSAASLSVTTTGTTSTIAVTAPSLPSGVTGINVYLLSGGASIGKVGTAASNTVTLTTLTVGTALPTVSTAAIATLIDLTSLTGAYGTVNLSKIKWLVAENTDSTVGQVITFGGAASNPWETWTTATGSTFILGPSPSCHALFDATGFAVNSTNKILKVIAKQGTPTVNIHIVGEGS